MYKCRVFFFYSWKYTYTYILIPSSQIKGLKFMYRKIKNNDEIRNLLSAGRAQAITAMPAGQPIHYIHRGVLIPYFLSFLSCSFIFSTNATHIVKFRLPLMIITMACLPCYTSPSEKSNCKLVRRMCPVSMALDSKIHRHKI